MINVQMDEMIESKQRASAANAFWILLLLCHAIYLFQCFALAQEIHAVWPTMVLCLGGTGIYLTFAFRALIPILPKVSVRMLLVVIVCLAVAMGSFVGIRNVFFLYAHNLLAYTIWGKVWMALQIALILSVELTVCMLLDFLVLSLLNRWQNQRILKSIEEENAE